MRPTELEPVPWQDVEKHINRYNPHRGSRDAWWSGIGVTMRQREWGYGLIPTSDLPDVSPASKRDVKRYAKHFQKTGSEFPAIVLSVDGDRVTVDDGAHRLAAARSLGVKRIAAYVGFLR